VDSSDRERIVEAREELHKMLSEEELRNAVLLVFANKQDLPNAASIAELANAPQLSDVDQRPWHIQACCAIDGEGLYEGLDWLSAELSKAE